MRHLVLLLCFSSGFFTTAWAQEQDQPSDEQQIRSAAKTYQTAFNSRDPETLAQAFTVDAEMSSPSGPLKGRDAIRSRFEELFQSEAVPELQLVDIAIDVISPNVAIETGTAIVTFENDSESTGYRAVHVKSDGTWRLDRVQDDEELPAPPSNYEKLKELEWMVGAWGIESGSSRTNLQCRWTTNRNFLVQSYVVSTDDGPNLEGTQVIGWDPVKGRIRSWLFDSDGGFGSGVWTEEGGRWRVLSLQVTPTAEEASATNLYSQVDENRFEFKSIGRQVGGVLLGNVPATVFVRR